MTTNYTYYVQTRTSTANRVIITLILTEHQVPLWERTPLRAKKKAGVLLGRPKGSGKSKLDSFQPEIEALLANGSTQKFIAKRYGTTEANLYHWMKKHALKRGK